ncbi:TBC domain-containing protein kinase-like protein [Mytilus galloprovincialis]|uniref:TBC domain-containing protein kinase-like protein n=1 Tax=Mytilus galloprovincialis TaxID=29158 RepID=UPI003F7B837C
MTELGKADFGVKTFFAKSHPNDKCGSNGLPLTPNSIKILGRFQGLTTIHHPRLCRYIDISKGRHERLIVVSEYYKDNLLKIGKTGKYGSVEELLTLAYEVLEGLVYLNRKSITHRNLSKSNILFDTKGNVKLSEYGLYHVTEYGANVSFPIGLPEYMPPEVLCDCPIETDEHADTETVVTDPCGPKTDVWSLGVILLEVFTNVDLWEGLSNPQKIYRTVEFLNEGKHPFDFYTEEYSLQDKIKVLPEGVLDFLRNCLTVNSKERPSPESLLQHKIFSEHNANKKPYKNGFRMFTVQLRSKDLELSPYDENGYTEDHLSERSMDEVYYLWRLAGGDLEGVLKSQGLVKTKPPVTLIPNFCTGDGDVFGQKRDRAELLDNTIVVLSQEQLRNRLSEVDEKAYYPLIHTDDDMTEFKRMPKSSSAADLLETASLPLIIREKDVEYQFHRVILYERLLKAYPYTRARVWKEARTDIPPHVRAHVWAAILEVEGDIHSLYSSIDKETATPTDRQIEVDIPRCHQYHQLLSSPTAHAKFKRVLKAWVYYNPQYVYWQGLDSLCAPFLALNFNDEALAFSCLQAFIPKYLHNFFMKDNSAVIQEYLCVFSHLIAFHDPELSNHLEGIGFIPDLYAIPWFLTMYAHVFPLHKLVHLWDTLLLGNSSFPLCIGVAILTQLKSQLISFGFNECILLFSDMPEINIELCVQDSIRIFCNTPKSAIYRQHARPAKKTIKADSRPNLSYYSRDYNDQPTNDLSMEPKTIEELRAVKCPHISAEDMIELGEFSGPVQSKSPTKRKHNSKPMLLVIDVRVQEEFNKGTIPSSINIPFQSAFCPEGNLNPCPAVTTLNAHPLQVKVVVGGRNKNALNFANELVRLGYKKVCVLHKGIDVLRNTSILTIPPADI